MALRKVLPSKIALVTCNTLFLLSGILLFVLSILLLSDTPRVLLSRLLMLGNVVQKARNPPFYYLALGLGCGGLIICSIALLGCWSACQRSKALLGTFIALLAVLLLGQAALVAYVSTLPTGRGLLVPGGILDANFLTETLQRNFGSSGQEQFTAAFDLAQYQFRCCGVMGPGDYETSWWRMQELGSRELRVPMTCCRLSNSLSENTAFLDPVPRNNTLCQGAAPPTSRNGERYNDGCLRYLDDWFTMQWAYAAALSVGLVILQLSVFASSISLCRRLPSNYT